MNAAGTASSLSAALAIHALWIDIAFSCSTAPNAEYKQEKNLYSAVSAFDKLLMQFTISCRFSTENLHLIVGVFIQTSPLNAVLSQNVRDTLIYFWPFCHFWPLLTFKVSLTLDLSPGASVP